MNEEQRLEKLKVAENQVLGFISSASTLAQLVMLKQLRLALPHQGTQINELESAIAKELKK